MHKLKKQYRLPGFNYASNEAYFVTIVCANRTSFFGEIRDGEMRYSEMGDYAENEIQMALKFKRNIQIPEYVIMPNHVHLIIVLQNEIIEDVPPPSDLPLGDGLIRRGHISPLQKGSLSAFVNRFKGRVTRKCKENGFMDFGWQARFQDRIIRSEKEYNQVAEYIINNVRNWDEDSENKRNY